MKPNGFTLIELMLVIVLLTCFLCMFNPILELFYQFKQRSKDITKQDRIAAAFKVMKKAFAGSQKIVSVRPNEVVLFSMHGLTSISFQEDGKKVILRKAGGQIPISTKGDFRIDHFELINSENLMCEIQVNGAKFPMYWRCDVKATTNEPNK